MSKSLAATALMMSACALIVSGCAVEPEAAPEPIVPAEPSAPAMTPPPTESPAAPNCTNIIAEDTLLTLEAEGFVLIDDYRQHLVSDHRVEELFFDNGGVDCMWGIARGGDSLVAFGYSPISEADALSAQEQLAASGYVRSESNAEVAYSTVNDTRGVEDMFLFAGGEWFHASTPEAMEEIRQYHR